MERIKTKGHKGPALLKCFTAVALPIIGLSFFILAFGFSDGSTQVSKKKVIVLGFDGMDPQILKNLIQEGKLLNFGQLIKTGDYKPLATSIPPQSPVAWSTFITGMNPGGHGIFDFIHR
ncbi:MAG: alkaline phosphatase family protein, partial [Planctomycetota bacterium]